MESGSTAITEVSHADFAVRVVEASQGIPVLVDFWAPWCQPCRMLAPILEQAAAEYAGRLTIAKVNTDQEPQLAAAFGIRSLPTLKLFRAGRPVAELNGAYPLAHLKMFLEPHLPRASDDLLEQARGLAEAGEREQAVSLLRKALASDPSNLRIHAPLTGLLLDQGKLDEAAAILDTLPEPVRLDGEFPALEARLKFARSAQQAPAREALRKAVDTDPDDLSSRYALGAVDATHGRHEEAMAQFLEILRRDRKFQDDGGRRALVDMFSILGNDEPLVRRYRSLLSSELH